MDREKTLKRVSDDLERRWEEFQRKAERRTAVTRRTTEDGAAWLDGKRLDEPLQYE